MPIVIHPDITIDEINKIATEMVDYGSGNIVITKLRDVTYVPRQYNDMQFKIKRQAE